MATRSKLGGTAKSKAKAKAKARLAWNGRMLERRRAVKDLNDLAEQLGVKGIPVIKAATSQAVESLIKRLQKTPSAPSFTARLYGAAAR